MNLRVSYFGYLLDFYQMVIELCVDYWIGQGEQSVWKDQFLGIMVIGLGGS